MLRVTDLPLYDVDLAVPLRGSAYADFLSKRLREARRRVWLATFVYELRPSLDLTFVVRRLTTSLEYAAWRGVELRVLLGASPSMEISIGNAVARSFLRSLRVPVRYFRNDRTLSLHSKYAIVDDDTIVVGSQNWSPGGLGRHAEDAVALHSPPLALQLSREFERLWTRALTE
jgi:phosphatidylserine/phosphatidylglycerophosphate/cardiolipin synthase-like enzyme